MPLESGVLGVFLDPRTAARAITAVRAAGCRDVRAVMPAPFPEVMNALGRPPSLLGLATLVGAAIGISIGYGYCIFTALAWPLVTGGKPIVAIPSFTIIGFELTVLFAVVITVGTLAALVLRGRASRALPVDLRFTKDRIGVFALGGDAAAIERALRDNGAEEVRRADA